MSHIIFRGPTGRVELDPSVGFLRSIILAPPTDYWVEGSGDGELESAGTGHNMTRLLILPHSDLGFYLKYLEITDMRIVNTHLSLGNRNKLSEVTTCSDDWLASVGLFLTPADAANAIEDFVLTGELSKRVEWIEPDAVPPEGNW